MRPILLGQFSAILKYIEVKCEENRLVLEFRPFMFIHLFFSFFMVHHFAS